MLRGCNRRQRAAHGRYLDAGVGPRRARVRLVFSSLFWVDEPMEQ